MAIQEPATQAAPVPPPPTVEEAQALITASPEFSDYQFTRAAISIPLTVTTMTPDIAALQKAKWISIDGAGNVVLTDKARADRRFLLRQNGFLDIVPLAKKELISVTAVRPGSGAEPLVDFRWQWVPNEIGALLGDRYAGEQQATATLLHDGRQWAVLRIQN